MAELLGESEGKVRCMALANSLHHGLVQIWRGEDEAWRDSHVALFSHAVMTRDAGAETEDEDVTTLRTWKELFAVEAIDLIRQDDNAWEFVVVVTRSSNDETERGEETIRFKARSDGDRTAWTRALLLAKQLLTNPASKPSDAKTEASAFVRFASSDSEDCASDDSEDDGDGEATTAIVLTPKHRGHATQPERTHVEPLTIIHVSAADTTGKSMSVSIPLTQSSLQQFSIHQIKLDALQQLRKQTLDQEASNDATETSSGTSFHTLLRREADSFVLFIAKDNIWLKDEHHPIPHYLPGLSDRNIHASLRSINEMPFPSIQLSISTTESKVSDLSRRTYTAYQINLTYSDMKWQVHRRYKEFHALHQQLKEKLGVIPGFTLPKLPRKRVFTPREGEFVTVRRQRLEEYLRQLLEASHTSQDVLVLSFLGFVSTSRDREMTKNDKNIMHVTALHMGLDFGDIVLFSTRFGASVIQRKVTRATYDHVGIVVPGESRNLLRILEATADGTHVYSLKARLMAYSREVSNSIVVRKFTADRSVEARQRLNDFVSSVNGNPYSILGLIHTRGESDRRIADERGNKSPATQRQTSPPSPSSRPTTPTGGRMDSGNISPRSNEARKRKYFCSSLVASALKHLGWLETTHSSSYFWPGSYEDGGDIEKYLAPGVSIGPETLVDCRIVEVGLATQEGKG
ncbi:hypothetical protein Poli38472_005301 [Pythium oligandrum]|uniref:PX domain-containing protein n=1 Tax=Pythium oligandrum TaxID=41045 RepID=A0A8K1FLH5_PYTOL|nr:hypothetical protein Poli38472_005301 [Pythium oligandrum]|eukprot:TMW62683.1 hypothetical protein Poli38472_005301 [Pythium oligandrum]